MTYLLRYRDSLYALTFREDGYVWGDGIMSEGTAVCEMGVSPAEVSRIIDRYGAALFHHVFSALYRHNIEGGYRDLDLRYVAHVCKHYPREETQRQPTPAIRVVFRPKRREETLSGTSVRAFDP